MTEFNPMVIHMAFSAGAGLFGVGVGWGIFRTRIKQIATDVDHIKNRQSRLRGEDNGGTPVYVTKNSCGDLRDQCARGLADKTEIMNSDIAEHTKQIKSLLNFARWFMQDKGLKISEINKILGES